MKTISKNKIAPNSGTGMAHKSQKSVHKANIAKGVEIDSRQLVQCDSAIVPMGSPRMVIHLRLNSITNLKKSLNRVIRAVARGQYDRETARTLGFLMQIGLQAWKTESDLLEIDKLRGQVAQLKEHLYGHER